MPDKLPRDFRDAFIDPSRDDVFSLIAIGLLAFVLADLTHEALGHGLATLATGAKPVALTTTYFTSSGTLSRWIPAGGGIANVIVGLLSLMLLRLLRPANPHVRLFLTLAVAFNLFFAAGYPAYSGIAAFGDWAAVISGLSPAWLWRVLLVSFSVLTYYFSMKLLALEMRPFCGSDAPRALNRLRRITLIPYVAAMSIAIVAGAFNPQGWTNIFTAALPAAAAAFGLTQLDHFPEVLQPDASVPVAGAITRSIGWIVAAVLVAAFFVGVLGPGVRF